MKEYVESLIKKAAEAGQGHDAMQFSQAALNAAKAVTELAVIFGVPKKD